jgi:alpha-galactosidase
MTQFDAFTTSLMTNRDVLDVNQDPLGKAASRVYQRERLELWARPLADGSIAIGLFNRGLQAAQMTATWQELGISGMKAVRDLWQQKDLGAIDRQITATVPAHGAVVFRITAVR